MSAKLHNKQTIAICGSMKVKNKMVLISQELEEYGYKVLLPNLSETSDYTKMKQSELLSHKHRMIHEHLDKIKVADAILVVNERLRDIEGYIGANSFLEMGFALALDKKIVLLYKIPEQSNKDEILGLQPIVLNGKVKKITHYLDPNA